MTVQVTLSFTNAAEAATFLASIGQSRAAVAPAPAVPAAAAAEAADRLFGSANKPATPATAASAPAAAAPAPATAPARVFDYDKDVLPSLVALSKVMDRANFAGTLARFGVSKVPELKIKPDCWKEVTEYAEGFVANAQKQAA